MSVYGEQIFGMREIKGLGGGIGQGIDEGVGMGFGIGQATAAHRAGVPLTCAVGGVMAGVRLVFGGGGGGVTSTLRLLVQYRCQ